MAAAAGVDVELVLAWALELILVEVVLGVVLDVVGSAYDWCVLAWRLELVLEEVVLGVVQVEGSACD